MFLRIAYLISESPNKTEFILLIVSFKAYAQSIHNIICQYSESLKLIQITKIPIQILIFSGLLYQ